MTFEEMTDLQVLEFPHIKSCLRRKLSLLHPATLLSATWSTAESILPSMIWLWQRSVLFALPGQENCAFLFNGRCFPNWQLYAVVKFTYMYITCSISQEDYQF